MGVGSDGSQLRKGQVEPGDFGDRSSVLALRYHNTLLIELCLSRQIGAEDRFYFEGLSGGRSDSIHCSIPLVPGIQEAPSSPAYRAQFTVPSLRGVQALA